MKKMWNMLRGKARRDDRGMSFVEVLCAVAIFSLVAGVIGTVLVTSTRTYKKGISETGIQQEAQLAANNIGNMVKDACSVVYGESGQQYLENGEDLMLNPDTTPKMQAVGFTELSIITNEDIQYTITYDEGNSVLMYQDSTLAGTEIMANNIVAFTADTTDFKKSKTIKLNMTVEDKSTNRRIPMEYTMTSRNDAVAGIYVSNPDPVTLIFEDSEVVLVPGETYKIPLVVAGKVKKGEDRLDWVSWGSLEKVSLSPDFDYAEVRVPIGTTSTSEEINVQIKDGSDNIITTALNPCTVLIRRVDNVQVTHSVDTTNSTGGMYETAGTVYTFTASVSGNVLEKRVAYDYDKYYKTAQAATWSYVLEINGADKTAQFDDYFEIDTAKTKEDALVPSFVIKAKKAMPATMKLTVRATSKHASGVNKADEGLGSNYYDGLGIDPVNIYYGEDTLEPRATKLNQGLEITLEPYETGTVNLGMKGGISSNVTFDFHDATDEGAGKTRAEYIPADDAVKITLGKDEMGSGPDGAKPYTFTIDVLVDGTKICDKDEDGNDIPIITVHVCRIDKVSIEVPKDVWHDDRGNKMEFPTYDFRARFNVDDANIDHMKAVMKHQLQYKQDGTLDEAAVKRTLSSKITWELRDTKSDFHYKDSVICMAGIGKGNTGEITGNYTKNYKKDGKEYYNVISVKPARVEQDGSGNWDIKQVPEIDISLSTKGTDTGLPKGYELTVTIEALHPAGTNKANTLYNKGSKTVTENGVQKVVETGIEASITIKGEMGIETPTQLVIVEPGQGVNSTDMSEKEMVVPIMVNGGEIYSMKATISENSDPNTKLASYSKGNPYLDSKTTSASKSTWYLGLLIGEKEKGNDKGCIKVHIDGYNDSKSENVVASYDFELGVRRVDEIKVRVAGSKNINTVNKANSTITLEALPNGCDNKTTAFYAIQKDEKGNTCRWEQKGHGEYKDPYVMEWRMFYNGKEKPLSEWTEYIDTAESVKPKTGTDSDNYKATVTFKLKEALPSGTKLRAYSLHALGKVGDTEYNKSGKKYNEVYGEITIGDDDIKVADGFKRGKAYTFIEHTDIPYVHADVLGWMTCLEQASFYRYREVGGTWSKYHMMDSKQGNYADVGYVPMSYLFRPDKEYDIEVVSVVYNKTDKLIYWPLDKDLLEKGRGWTEAGFTFWKLTEEQWQRDWPNGSQYYHSYSEYQELYGKVQAIPEVKQTFRIPKCEMYFNPREDASSYNSMTVSEPVTSVGSESNPIRLNGNNLDKSDYEGFLVDLEITGYEMGTDQNCFRTIVQKKSGNQWITLGYDDESAATGEGFKVDSGNPKISIYRTANAQGLYRVAPIILAGEKTQGKIQWRSVTEIPRSDHTDMDILFTPEYTTTEENYNLCDYSTGKYVIYFEFYR